MAESLSRKISEENFVGDWTGVQVGHLDEPYFHNLFIDDTLLFGHEFIREARVIKNLIDDYCLSSG